MKKILTIISICILGLAACSRSYEVHYDFGFDRQELRFKATNTASYFMVYGDGDWTLTLSKDAPWLTLDATSGTGMTQVKVRLAKNEGVARDVTIVAEYHDGSQAELIISQEASSSSAKAYSLSASTVSLLKLERDLTIPATAKFIPESLGELKYWVEYSSDEDKDWIEGLQFNYTDVTMKVKENTSAADRTAHIFWTFPVAHWEIQDTLSFAVSQTAALPSLELDGSYTLDPASLDSLKICPDINWDTAVYDFDLSKFSVSEGVTGKYVESGNYLALIAERNTSGQSRSFNLEWSVMDDETEVVKYTAELVQNNFEVSISLKDSYNLDPEGIDSLRVVPTINWDPSVFDFDLSNFTVSEGVTGKYVKSGNYIALVAEPNTSRQARNFTLQWSVMDNGVEAAKATSTLVQGFYIPPINLTPNGEYANSYVLTDVEENSYSIDAVLVSGEKPADDIVSAAVLWETSEGLITRCSYDAATNKLYVGKKANAMGNAVVKLMNASGKVRWSYHFWMTNTGAAVPEITVGGHVFLDRNLGAVANTAPLNDETDAAGMYYQWGRKDPFPSPTSLNATNGSISMTDVYPSGAVSVETQQNGVSVETSIMNPNKYYWGSHNKGAQDWCSTPYDLFWSTSEKTDMDPCPYGYVVPDKSQMEKFVSKISSNSASRGFIITDDNSQTNYFCKGGYFRRKQSSTHFAHVGQEPHCWTTGTGVNTETSGDAQNETNKDYNGAYATGATSGKNVVVYARRWGCNIRCVKQTKTNE